MAAGNASIATYTKVLKQLYQSEKAINLLYKESPLLAMIPKKNIFQGLNYNLAVINGGQQGISANISSAIANKSSSEFTTFQLTRGRIFAVGSIDREVIMAAKSGQGSMVYTSLETERETIMTGCGRHLSRFLFGDGGGSFATVVSFTGATITVAPNDTIWFEKGQVWRVASAPTGAASRTGSVIVSGINRLTGVVTFTTTITASIAAIANGDAMFIDGNNVADGNSIVVGLGAWLFGPTVTSTPFFGVDRTSDPTRLAGLSYTGAGAIKAETLKAAYMLGWREGCRFDICVVNQSDYQDIALTEENKLRYVERTGGEKSKNVEVGFRGVAMDTVGGSFDMLADPACPVGTFYFLTLDTWALYTLAESKNFPEIVDNDGNTIRLDPTTDSFTFRLTGYGQLGCRAPGRNMKGSF